MIHSILHQIWNQRRSNGWLFAELLIVFTLIRHIIPVQKTGNTTMIM